MKEARHRTIAELNRKTPRTQGLRKAIAIESGRGVDCSVSDFVVTILQPG